MKWAFIDYENVGCLSKVDLSCYERVIIFLGANQPKLDFGDVRYDKPINLILVQLKATQANNLDFHLSYYLGKFDNEAPADITFEVVSSDGGFSPLIAHIKNTGRPCKQLRMTSTPADIERLVHSLVSTPKEKRPQKVTSLRNHIAAQLKLKGNELAIQQQLNHLINTKVLQIAGDSIEYQC